MPPPKATVKTVRASADDLEPALAQHLFLGGAKPSKEDVDLFNAMFGEENTAVTRWVRNAASFTTLERQSWGKPE